MEHAPHVNVQSATLGIGYLAYVTFVRFLVLILLRIWRFCRTGRWNHGDQRVVVTLLLHGPLQFVQMAHAIVMDEENILLSETLFANIALVRSIRIQILLHRVRHFLPFAMQQRLVVTCQVTLPCERDFATMTLELSPWIVIRILGYRLAVQIILQKALLLVQRRRVARVALLLFRLAGIVLDVLLPDEAALPAQRLLRERLEERMGVQQALLVLGQLVLVEIRVGGFEVSLERLDRAKRSSAEGALGRVPDGVILRVLLQLLQRLEREAALAASILVYVFLADGERGRSGRMDLPVVLLQLLQRAANTAANGASRDLLDLLVGPALAQILLLRLLDGGGR